MAKDNEGQSVRDYGERKKRIRRRRKIIIGMAIIALLVGGGIYLYNLYNKSYTSFELLKSMENTVENGTQYLQYGNGVLKYSKDGATAIDKDGKLKWNGSYEMNQPIADVCGDYAVVADQGGTSIQIFDGKGFVESISTIHAIIKVEIAHQGVVYALQEADNMNYLFLYDKDGTVLGEKVTTMSADGYPIDISISDDGLKLITSYLTVNTGELTGIASFYNFGEVGQNWIDNLVGGFKFEGIIAPRVFFNNNDTACVFKENGFMLIEYSEMPRVIKEISFENTIKSILYNEKYVGVVIDAGETGYRGLVVYNLKGEKILDKKLDFDYKEIRLVGEEIIMIDNVSCIVMKINGSVKFSHTFGSDIIALYPINSLDQYYYVSEKEIAQIRLVE